MKGKRIATEKDLNTEKFVHDAKRHDVEYKDDLQFTCYTCETEYYVAIQPNWRGIKAV